MKNMKSAFTLTLLTSFLFACNSPILKHASAEDQKKISGVTATPGAENEPRLAAACPLSFPKAKLCANLEWLSPPSLDEEKPGRLRLRFWNSETGAASGPYVNPDSSLSGAKVAVKLWMPDMGHGSSPVKIGVSKDAQGNAITGVFDTQEVYFSMGGHWEVFIQLKQGNTVAEQSKIDVEL